MRCEAPEPAGSSCLQEGVKPAAVVQTSSEYSELMQLSNNDRELVHKQLPNFQNKSKGFLHMCVVFFSDGHKVANPKISRQIFLRDHSQRVK